MANNPTKHSFLLTKHFCYLNRFPSYRDSFACSAPQIIPLLGKTCYLFLCFGTSQYHLYYQVVPVLSLLHSIIDGDHSERTYKYQLQAYDLPTCPSTLSALVFFIRSTAQDDTWVGSVASSTLSRVWHFQLHVWHLYVLHRDVHVVYLYKLKCYRC